MFLGFLPATTKARRELLATYATLPCALVIYEAPQRVRATAAALASVLGSERDLIVARELTKKFETLARMPLREAEDWFAADANRERGEFVLLVDAPAPSSATSSTTAIAPESDRLLRLLLTELPPTHAARIVAEHTGQSRDALYAHAAGLRK